MSVLIFVLVGFLIVALVGGFAFAFVGNNNKKSGLRELMGSASDTNYSPSSINDPEGAQLLKERTGRSSYKKKEETVDNKLFRAGIYSKEDKAKFFRKRFIYPIFTTPVIAGGMFWATGALPLTLVAGILGLFIGLVAPYSGLDRRIRLREEDTLYYLPLVIEQISIGVSSALDVGPCIGHIVTMADERESHNPVTEMLVHVERLMRSGLNLEDSLVEVGETNGMSEVKHAFMFLAQCAKHGGEISQQLQELADSVMVQRQTQVEGKITALPVKATGPLAMVFAGFFALLFAGLMVRLLNAFG